jgi:excisionase family DNA binding protein
LENGVLATFFTDRPVTPAPEEAERLRLLDSYTPRPAGKPSVAKLVGPDGETFEIPESHYEVLHRAARQLAAGMAVSIVPVGTQLSTQQAAELLGVSRPHVVKLVDSGEIPHTKTGKHRRVLLDDVLAYKALQSARRSEALDELSRLSKDLPLT